MPSGLGARLKFKQFFYLYLLVDSWTGDWSSGMIPASGAGGREFDSILASPLSSGVTRWPCPREFESCRWRFFFVVVVGVVRCVRDGKKVGSRVLPADPEKGVQSSNPRSYEHAPVAAHKKGGDATLELAPARSEVMGESNACTLGKNHTTRPITRSCLYVPYHAIVVAPVAQWIEHQTSNLGFRVTSVLFGACAQWKKGGGAGFRFLCLPTLCTFFYMQLSFSTVRIPVGADLFFVKFRVCFSHVRSSSGV